MTRRTLSVDVQVNCFVGVRTPLALEMYVLRAEDNIWHSKIPLRVRLSDRHEQAADDLSTVREARPAEASRQMSEFVTATSHWIYSPGVEPHQTFVRGVEEMIVATTHAAQPRSAVAHGDEVDFS